uniref:Uncharacterized protein n=1 Tax=Oryza sativa subsp. japonica TaxID=39947 RepID=Q6K6X5_ORYSJ|nr:hypothetical protein [Oryza sativa Japonica Group]BAD19604.1 hypothetical protein [Oryza sativa Japonica Group]
MQQIKWLARMASRMGTLCSSLCKHTAGSVCGIGRSSVIVDGASPRSSSLECIRDGSGCRWFEGSNAAENVPVSSLLADECGLSR